jgi:hypothetical protein
VRFSLPGFAAVERGNVVINSGFTATIDAELGVGGVAETVTVTGESPLVDVRSASTQFVVTDEVINTIPSSRNLFDMGKFMVGFSTGRPEVGGSRSQNYGDGWQIHGSQRRSDLHATVSQPTPTTVGTRRCPTAAPAQ